LTMPTISLEAKRAADHSALSVVTALCVPLLAVALLMKIGLVLPLVALLALGAVWFAIRHVEWVAPTLLFLLYSNFTVAATHMYGVPENAASGVFALMAIPFAVQCYRQGLIFDRTFGFMISLFVVMIISAGASESPEDSFEALIRYGGEGLAVYLLVVNTVRDRLALRRCLGALLLAGAITGSLSAIESAGGPQIFSGSTADSSVATESGTSGGDRSTGSVGEANRFGQMLVVVLPFTLLFYRAAGSRAGRVIMAAAGLMIVTGLLLTYSRTAFLALGVFVFSAVVTKQMRARTAAVAVGILLLATATLTTGLLTRVATVSSIGDVAQGQRAGDSSVRMRASLLLMGARMFSDHPVFGVGPGQSNLHIPEYDDGSYFSRIGKTKKLHNMYIEQLAETGIIGFALFMATVTSVLGALWRRRRSLQNPGLNNAFTALLLSIVLYLVTGLALHLSYQRFFWVLIALAGAAVHIFDRELTLAQALSPSTRHAHRLYRWTAAESH
jgi:O-antigen ligase